MASAMSCWILVHLTIHLQTEHVNGGLSSTKNISNIRRNTTTSNPNGTQVIIKVDADDHHTDAAKRLRGWQETMLSFYDKRNLQNLAKKTSIRSNVYGENGRISDSNALDLSSFGSRNVINSKTSTGIIPVNGCTQVEQTITCDHIPLQIPGKVTTVIINVSSALILTNIQFADKTWKRVRKLYLNTLHLNSLNSNCFKGLENLQELVLDAYHANNVYNTSLNGLQKLKKLEWTGISREIIQTLESALQSDEVLPSLEEFAVNPISVQFHKTNFKVSDKLAEALINKPLKSFKASNVIFNISPMSAMKIVLKVDDLNFTDSNFLGPNLNLFDNRIMKIFSMPKYLLQSLDISGVTFSYLNNNFIPSDLSTQSKANFFLYPKMYKPFLSHNCSKGLQIFGSIKNIYLNNIKRLRYSTEGYIYCTDLPIKTKLISMRGINFVSINLTIVFNTSNSIETFDLAQNGMVFLSPLTLYTLINLQSLYLSQNKLGNMESTPGFSILFKPLINLRILLLDENEISTIPWNMFQSNVHLEVLSLASNSLKTITFDLSRLQSLQTLDLQSNKIHSVDGTWLNLLENYIKLRLERSETSAVNILFHNNPLYCSCQTTPFIKWLMNYMTLMHNSTTEGNRCTYQGSQMEINGDTVHKCEFLCHRTVIITCSAIISPIVLIAVVSLALTIKHYRKRRLKENLVQQFIKDLEAGRLEQSSIMFAAMSSHEEEFIMTSFLPSLETQLEESIKLKNDLILTGSNFRPGYSIVVEAHRLIKASCVMVALVSEAFCRSNYCNMEIQEACNQQKPIIFISLENIDEDSMSPYLLDIFKRNTRAKIERGDNGTFQINPSIEILVEAIITLATEQTLL